MPEWHNLRFITIIKAKFVPFFKKLNLFAPLFLKYNLTVNKSIGGNMKSLKIAMFFAAITVFVFPLKSQQLKKEVYFLNNPEIRAEVEKGDIRIGNLTVSPKSLYSASADGKDCGFVIPDGGKFILKIKNKYCIPVCERNAKRWRIENKISDGQLILKKEFLTAYVISVPYNARKKVSEGKINFPEKLKKFLNENPYIDPGMDIEGAKLQGNDIAVAIFETKFGYFYYVFDPDNEEKEQLFYLRKSKYTDVYEMFEIAYQPVDREIYELTGADFSVNHIDLNVINTEKDLVNIHAKLTITANTNLEGLSFDLLNSYYTFRTNTREVSGSRVLRVNTLTVNGKDVEFVHQTQKLLVKLPGEVKKGDRVILEVKLSGDILNRLFGDNFWQLDTFAWYPKAKLKEERATVHIKATVPDNFTVFASGDTKSFNRQDGYKTVETELDFPIQRPLISAGKYFIHKKKALGRSCIVATHGTKKDKNSKRLLNYFFAASDIIERGVNKPYPFKDQYIIETNFDRYFTGPSIIYVGSEIFNPKYETIDDLNLLFINDIARAYFRFRINIPNENEFWISEAFSQYIAAITYTRLFKKRKVAQKKFIKILRKWKRGTELVKSGDSIYLASHLSGKKSKDWYDMIHLYYDKAPLVLHALRLEMQKKYGAQNGDRMFFVWISSILKSFSGKYVNTYDCIRLLNMITRDNWKPFFEKYIFGDRTPELNI